MEPLGVLLANEPRSYREVLAGALRLMRPHWAVSVLAPAEVPAHLGPCAREVVICSRLSESIRRGAFGWVVLYPDHENRATIHIAGKEATVEDLDFDGLLAVLDRAEAVALAAGPPAALR